MVFLIFFYQLRTFVLLENLHIGFATQLDIADKVGEPIHTGPPP